MKSRIIMAGLVAILFATLPVVQGDDDDDDDEDDGGTPFFWLAPGYTQELWGVTESYATSTGYLGGVAVLQSGDVLASECMTSGTRLHRFAADLTYSEKSTELHQETILPAGGGCGMVLHPDGTLYLNADPCPRQMNANACATGETYGVVQVDPDTGKVLRKFGPRGNALGIAVDPIFPHRLVYAGRDCSATLYGTAACTLHDIDTGPTPTAVPRAVFDPNVDVGYVGGLYFDPTGEFIFLDNRFPTQRLTVISRAGGIEQHVDLEAEPIGIGFHATAPKFVVTNNYDPASGGGTMTRFDFPGDNYEKPPVVTPFASGGYRGDLMQVGPDSCLYLTQGGARYENNHEEGPPVNSIVRICGGFAPPPGITLVDTVPPTTTATLAPPPNLSGWNNTNVSVTLNATDEPNGSGVWQISYSVTGAETVAPTTVDGNTASMTLTTEGISATAFFSTDNAGNVEDPKTKTVQIDKTPPTIIGTRTPAPNASGWNNTPVTVSFSCDDALSGIAPGSEPAPTTLSTNGAGQSVTGACRDRAGNEKSATVGDINIALTGPTLTIKASKYELWPPNGKNVADVISGLLISPLGIDPNTAVFKVIDSYGEVQPSGKINLKNDGKYSFTVNLSTKRSGTDKAGREYTIIVTGSDYAGNQTSGSVVVRVPHDQGRGKK